jgi:alpha-amylase
MCTKYFSDGDVHKYFNPYDTPYDAYIAFMNALYDVKLRVQKKLAPESVSLRVPSAVPSL